MKKILVATDFTEYADYAIKSAASIAKQTGAQLILLHVVNRPLDLGDESYENYHNMPGGDKVISSTEEKLANVVKRHDIKGAKIIYELRYDVFKTILRQAELNEVDLIVMGAYGSYGNEDTLIGSNTERVMQNAKMPVLIIKEKFQDFNIENMVLASTFHGQIYEVFPHMKRIIGLFNTNLHLLTVNTPTQFQTTNDSMEQMEKFSEKFALHKCTKNIYNDLTIEDGIINFTASLGADLIAITPDGLWRLAHVFNKNITRQLMKKSAKAILSMRTNQLELNPA